MWIVHWLFLALSTISWRQRGRVVRASDLKSGDPQFKFRSGACFSKIPKLFGRVSGDIILFVSSKRRRLEARNFAAILMCVLFITYEKFYEWLFGPEKFSGLSRNRPQARAFTMFDCKYINWRSTTRRQRQRHKFFVFNEQKHALHMLFLFLYISFQFSANLRREMTVSQILQRT